MVRGPRHLHRQRGIYTCTRTSAARVQHPLRRGIPLPVGAECRFEFLDSPAMYIASSYSRPEIIQWLLGEWGLMGSTLPALALSQFFQGAV